MRIRTIYIYAAALLVAAGCAGPQFFPLQGAPRYRVALRSVNFEREIANGEWKSLAAVASDRAGNPCVLDASTHQVFVCDAQGAVVRRIGETGFWKKTFPKPSGIAVDGEGRIYVSDAKDDCVTVLDRAGAFSARIGGKGSSPGKFRDPMGLDLDALRNLYVVDQGNTRVQKFDPRGMFITQIVSGPKDIEKVSISRTDGPIKFITPPKFKQLRDLTVGADNMVYVLDEGLCVIHVYTPEGAYLFSFGGKGGRAGKFLKPSGITAGGMGIVCVSDDKKNNIQFFDPEGRFLTSVGGRGSGRGQFKEPVGVGASPEGLVFVADKGNRRIQAFSFAVPRQEVTAVRLDKPVRIAVFDFKNNNPQAQSRGYGETISEMFITALAQRPNFEVIERKQVRKVIDEINFDQSGVVDAETATKIGKLLGIDVALAGGVSLFQDGIEIDLRLLDVETGKVITADALKAGFESQLRDFVNREVIRLENRYLVQMCPPAPPAGLVIEGGVKECAVSWKASAEPDFKEYKVYRAESTDGPYALIGTTRKTGWVDKGLADGGKYYYRITAVDTTGKESKYLAGTEGGARGRPAIGELAVRSEIGVKRSSFSWSENETDVTGYLIYRSKSPEGPFTQVGESRTSKFSERGFGDGETYYYKVAKKYRSGLQSEQSNAFTASTKPIPSVPEGFAAKSGLARRAVLEWGNPKESDIREFRVYRSDAEDGEYRRIAIVKPGWLTSPGYTDAKLKDNTTYFYKIQAVDRDDLASPMSTPVKATTKPVPAVPRGFVAESGKARSVPLTWNRNDEKDIRSYRIHCAEKEGGPYRTIAETADTSTTHIGLKDKTTYYYKIMAVDRDSLESGFSPVVSATTKPRPRKPTGAAAESGLPRRIELTWNPNPESDIARYTIARREGRIGAFKDVAQRRENAHIDENLGDGKTYQYTIKAVDADGLTSDASESLQATTKSAPAAPRGLTVEPGGGALVLHWNTSPEPDIAGYEIFRSTAWDILGGETIVGQSAAPPFEDRTAKPGKKYIYRIIAVDTTGLRSEKSGKAMASIPSP